MLFFKDTPVHDAREGKYCVRDARRDPVHDAHQQNIQMHDAQKLKKPWNCAP